MRAALMAAEQGHRVTLYEKSDHLGGQLIHADFAAFKWALRDYKNYLIEQISKHPNITILLNNAPDPADVAAAQFDAVFAACGAEQKVPLIPGADCTPFYTPLDTFGHEEALGHRVVVVGGAETGTETGMYLAEAGHQVTVLTRSAYLASEAWSVHAYSLMKRRWESNPNFVGITEAETQSIAPGKVVYKKGNSLHTLECDSIVLSGGVKSRTEEALRYAGCAKQFFVIGDCRQAQNLQYCNRSALAAVSKL